MPSQNEWIVLLGIGGLFILLGLGAYIWGIREEQSYYNAISRRHDAREFLEHWPARPEPGALKTGGRIAMSLGFLMVIAAGALLLWG